MTAVTSEGREPVFQTPFERNILPRFSRWLAHVLEETRPDVIMPVERKGAHLLDAALDYLRSDATFPIRSQILSKRSLFFNEPSEWVGKSVLLLDDTVHSGRTLSAYKDALKASGDPVVKMIACVGAPLKGEDANRRAQDAIRCFLEPPQRQYQEYVWQIAEHIASRGMPPEVDHHVFRMTSGLPLADLWADLLDILDSQGALDIYDPSADGAIRGATLHWPHFMEEAALPAEGRIRKEGVVKIRLFADSRRNCVWLMPMAYPRVEISNTKDDGSELELSRSAIENTRVPQAQLARLVLDEARAQPAQAAAAAEILFHAVSLSCETELTRRLTNVLQSSAADLGNPQVSCDQAAFLRLYGNRAGMRIVSAVDQAISEKGTEHVPSKGHAGRNGEPSRPVSSMHMESDSVHDTTDSIAKTLKSRYLDVNRGKSERRRWETVGMSFSELFLLDSFAKAQEGNLLLSRCIDYGCATTTLVPFVRVSQSGPSSSWTVDRTYRTSESMSDIPDRTEDLKTYMQEVAAETVAAVAHFLSRRSVRWRDRRPPLFVVEKVLAILLASLDDDADSALVVVPQEHGPEIAYEFGNIAGPTQQLLIRNMRTEHYAVLDDGVEATPAFVAGYERGTIRLHLRKSLPLLEAALGALVPVLDESEDVAALLTNWGSSSTGKLGLDFAMYDVDKALSELLAPINVLASGRSVVSAKLLRSTKNARQYLGVAVHAKVEELQKAWGDRIRERWPRPIEVERSLLRSVLEPAEKDGIYPIARTLCRVVTCFTDLVDQIATLDAAQSPQKDMFGAPAADPSTTARALLHDLDRLAIKLRTMRGDSRSLPHLPTDSQALSIQVGRAFKEAYDALRQFARAIACNYEGRRNVAFESRPIGVPRIRTVFAADLKDSTVTGLALPASDYSRWESVGVSLIAQWGHAFGGKQVGSRRGDEIIMDFREADSALLCGCLVQEHLRALRSIGAGDYRYVARIALDSYEVHPGEGDNMTSSALDRASKLTKFCKAEDIAADVADRIWLTPEAGEQLSDAARSYLKLHPREIDLGAEVSGACFAPFTPDLRALLGAYLDRLNTHCGKT